MKNINRSKDRKTISRRSFLNTAAAGTAGIAFVPLINNLPQEKQQTGKWTGNFRPCEIKSLRLNCKTRDIKEVNLLEE